MKQLVMYHQQQVTECWKQLEPEKPLSIKELPALLQSRLEKHTAEVSELTAKVAVTQQQYEDMSVSHSEHMECLG